MDFLKRDVPMSKLNSGVKIGKNHSSNAFRGFKEAKIPFCR